jgi:hypothetical protein
MQNPFGVSEEDTPNIPFPITSSPYAPFSKSGRDKIDFVTERNFPEFKILKSQGLYSEQESEQTPEILNEPQTAAFSKLSNYRLIKIIRYKFTIVYAK